MPFKQSIPQSLNQNILYRADCKEALNHLIENSIKVDLIYLDPPFNSSRTYNVIFTDTGVTAQQKAFHDMWTVTAQTKHLVLDFEETIENSSEISDILKMFLKAWVTPLKDGTIQDKKMLVYLVYMTERLVLMKKVLKETGSIYFHCDPTASHYVKIIMDGIFGRENFRNEIAWGYRTGGTSNRWFSKKHDIIFFYTKNDNNTHFFEKQYYRSYQKYKYGFGNKHGYELLQDKETGQYYKNSICRDIWDDIEALGTQGKPNDKRLGYPTQKPLALLDRIIKASCPDNGVILDPFCGCGTTIESAILNKKKWIGVDISSFAIDIIKKRIKDVRGEGIQTGQDHLFLEGNPKTKDEYDKMNPYEKQDWLINKIGGFPNPRKSGDGGVDGEMTIHMGFNSKGKDTWGKMVFSVKTGSQCKPEFIRELNGTMNKKYDMGGLIMEADPTPSMELTAQSKGQIKYQPYKNLPPSYHDKIQIRTVQEIIDGKYFDTPKTQKEIYFYRKKTPSIF